MTNYSGLLLYIDPGTGSMLISVFIGVFASLWFLIKKVYIKFKYGFSLNRDKISSNSKDDSIVIFSDSKRYITLFLPILKELDSRNIKARYLTFDDDDPILFEKFVNVSTKCIGKGNKAFSILNTLSTNVVLSTTPSLDVYQWKRSKDVNKYIHILHEVGGANEYRMFALSFFDSVLLTGNFQIDEVRELEKIQHSKEKELVVVGSTYMDELQKRYDTFENTNCVKDYVLVAPTWGKNGLLSRYGEKLIESLLNTNYSIIIRPHPQSLISDKKVVNYLFDKYKNCDRIEFNYDIDNFDVLHKSLIMISDYSGVIFDYSLVFNKPVLYISSDINSDFNDSWFLDHEIYRYEAMRSLGKELREEDFSNLQTIIEETVKSKSIESNRNEIRDVLWQNRGDAAKLVANYIENA